MYQRPQPPKTPGVSGIIVEQFKVFFNFLVTFFQKSNVHGIRFVFNKNLHPVERLLWLGFVLGTSFGAYSISSKQYERYVANPTVISLERDYRDWNGTLPAIFVCYHKRIDESRAKLFIKKKWGVDSSDNEFSYFFDFVQAVVHVNESFSKFNSYVNDKRLEFVDMLEISKEVHPIMNSVVSSFDSTAEFTLNEIITEKGICYSVNSLLSPLISTK